MKIKAVVRPAQDKRAWLMCGVALALALCAGGVAAKSGGPRLRPIAEPGDVVAVELNFARAAQDKGQWTAFADYAAPNAVMFVPQPVKARDWLKGRANPAQAISWQPFHIWSSCDGSLALSQGAWQGPDGKAGTFATLWQRQKDGSYKWLLDHGETLASPPEQPEMVSTDIADCPPRAPDSMGAGMAGRPAPAPPQPAKLPVADLLRGEAQDGTMRWEANVSGNVRQLHVYLKRNGAMQEIFASTVTEPAQ